MRHYRQNFVIICVAPPTNEPYSDDRLSLKRLQKHREAGPSKMAPRFFCTILIITLGFATFGHPAKRREDKTKCPHVKAIRNFDLQELLGSWYVVQYYASSEEALSYGCMRPVFTMSPDRLEVSMNFTYTFTDDPAAERLYGNITWDIPNPSRPSHWVHAEDTYEGVYNTYVLDSDYKSWALLLHCAEKSKSPRYLSSFVMSRQPILAPNVVTYLREKLPRYDIDLAYMFPMSQTNCSVTNKEPGLDSDTVRSVIKQLQSNRRHPMKNVHKH